MQMIDLMKRLAELDAKNSNVVNEVSWRQESDWAKSPATDPTQRGQGKVANLSDKALRQTSAMDDEIEQILNKFESNIDEIGGYADPAYRKAVYQLLQQGKIKQAVDEIHGAFRNKDGGEVRGIDQYLDQLEADLTSVASPQPAMSESLSECGMMNSTSQPHTPASINVTASSGEELSAMLKDILSLAGMHKVEPEHLGMQPEPAVVTMEPDISVSNIGDAPSMMRSMMDKLNPDDEENTSEEAYTEVDTDNTPDPELAPPVTGNQDQSGTPGAAMNRGMKNHPVATPVVNPAYESLMSEYQRYLSEN